MESYSDKSLWNFTNSNLNYGYSLEPLTCDEATDISISQPDSFTPININTASQSELETLPGIGETKAKAIISLRPFQTISDIKKVSGIGEATFQKIKAFNNGRRLINRLITTTQHKVTGMRM